MRWRFRLAVAAALVLTHPSRANDASFITAPSAVRVVDGDTLEFEGDLYRLWGIDAPEGEQVCFQDGLPVVAGRVAAATLSQILQNGTRLICGEVDVDRTNRPVVSCFLAGTDSERADVAEMLVRAGVAFDYPKYSGGRYAEAERAGATAPGGLKCEASPGSRASPRRS